MSLEEWTFTKREVKKNGFSFVKFEATNFSQEFKCAYSQTNGALTVIPFNQQRLEWFRNNVVLRERDIVIATYPKCGTTLLEQIVLLSLGGYKDPERLMHPKCKNVYHRRTNFGKIWPLLNVVANEKDDRFDSEVAEDEELDNEFSITMSIQEFKNIKGRRVIKLHMPADLCTFALTNGLIPKGVKVIFCVRDPRDAVVSAYYHPGHPAGSWDFHAFAAFYSKFGFPWATYSYHARSWLDMMNKCPDAVILLKYEDIIKDMEKTMLSLLEFLDIKRTQTEIKEICTLSSFSNMKKSSNNADHMRKGKVGDNKSMFSEQGLTQFEERMGITLRGTVLFDAYFGDENLTSSKERSNL